MAYGFSQGMKPDGPEREPDDPRTAHERRQKSAERKKRATGMAKHFAGSPALDVAGPMAMPLRAALAGAAMGLEAPETESIEEVGVVGKVMPIVGSAVGTGVDIVSEAIGSRVDQASAILFGKQERRAAEAKHAAATSTNQIAINVSRLSMR